MKTSDKNLNIFIHNLQNKKPLILKALVLECFNRNRKCSANLIKLQGRFKKYNLEWSPKKKSKTNIKILIKDKQEIKICIMGLRMPLLI